MFRLMGSTYFFKEYPDFRPKDLDYWAIEDFDEKHYFKLLVRSKPSNEEYYIFKKVSKEEHIQRALTDRVPMVVGKFLIPEFCNEIGFTIEDLPKMKPLIDTIDTKHDYERVIFEAYLENGAFVLTKEQRDMAYKSYKETRNQ